MVDLLVLIHGFVDVRLDTLTCPENVPLVTFSLSKTACLHYTLDEFRVCLHHLKEHLELSLLVLARFRITEHVDAISIDLEIELASS